MMCYPPLEYAKLPMFGMSASTEHKIDIPSNM